MSRPITDHEGNVYPTVDAWMAEVELRATVKFGPRETRYKNVAARPVRFTTTRNTWSEERGMDASQAKEDHQEVSEENAKGETSAGSHPRDDDTRDRASAQAAVAAADTADAGNTDTADHDAPDSAAAADARDGASRDRADRGLDNSLLRGDAPPASGPHVSPSARRHDPAGASTMAGDLPAAPKKVGEHQQAVNNEIQRSGDVAHA